MGKTFEIMMKDPDGIYESFKNALESGKITEAEAESIREKYFEYDEYCYITFGIDGDVITPILNRTDVAF